MNHHPQVPEVEYHVTQAKRLSPSPSQRLTNSVIVVIDTKSIEIHANPTTGRQYRTGRSTSVSPRHLININLRSLCHNHIRSLLQTQLVTADQHRLCDELASKISTAATDIGFGYNGFTLTIYVTITYQNFLVMPVVPSSSSNIEGVLRMVLLGRMKAEELKMETESCSICLENLSSLKPNVFLTRMTCSHVFHSRCLLEWLYRKNTCPLCRTVLYDR